ncbi:MAG: hypothetical protein ACLFP8_03040 [Alphaproteobacteria bacterium]
MKRAELLTVIMHDIGLPVIEGIIQVALDRSEDKVVEDVTRLLRQTVDHADDIRGLLDLAEDEEQDVSIRLNLATLSCHVIAAHYKRTGNLPTQAELKRTVSSIDRLLAFSENYIPMGRLDGVFPENIRGLSPLSRAVANLVYLKYYVPLIDAVAEFSFGQKESRIIQDVSERLREKATEITHALMGKSLGVAEQKSSEMLILSSLVPLYCACHNQEKNRIMALDEDARTKETSKDQIENIWLLFDKRLSMMSVLAKHIMPDHFSDDDIAKIDNLFTDGLGLVDVDSTTAQKDHKTSGSEDMEDNKTSPKKDAGRISGDDQAADTSAQAPVNPMGFFAVQEEEAEEVMPVKSEASASISSDEGQEDDTTDDEGDDEGDDSGSGADHSNPMSFFKK